MDPQYSFLAAAAFTVLVPAVVVVTLWRPIFLILVDLCGTEVRAGFWRMYSALAIVLGPLTTLFTFHTENPSHGVVFAIVDNARWSLFGLIAALFFIAWGVMSSIMSPCPTLERVRPNNDTLDRLATRVDEIRHQHGQPG